jgi:hypothetical protein
MEVHRNHPQSCLQQHSGICLVVPSLNIAREVCAREGSMKLEKGVLNDNLESSKHYCGNRRNCNKTSNRCEITRSVSP